MPASELRGLGGALAPRHGRGGGLPIWVAQLVRVPRAEPRAGDSGDQHRVREPVPGRHVRQPVVDCPGGQKKGDAGAEGRGRVVPGEVAQVQAHDALMGGRHGRRRRDGGGGAGVG